MLQDPPRTWAKNLNPLLLLDYRCHTNEGAIGKDFPPALRTCMQFLASKTKQEIQVGEYLKLISLHEHREKQASLNTPLHSYFPG
jgi:hypothetical protein